MRNLKSGCQLTALSLISLYTSASTLSGAMILWTVNAHFAAPVVAQQPRPRTLPSLPPASAAPPGNTPISAPATAPANPIGGGIYPPVPPLGYPNQTRNQSAKFNVYRLGIGDTISATVQRFPDLNFQGIINTEGFVTVPLVGAVSLVGLTLEEAKEKIRFGLNKYVIDPDVTVSLANPRPAQVTLTGELVKPGFYTFQSGSQLSAALVAAGGATNVADLRSVLVRRSLFDGSIIEQRVDLFTPLQNGQPLPELRLQDGDAVVVSKLEVGTYQDYDRRLVSRSSLSQQQIVVKVLSYANGGIGNVTLPNGSNFVDALAAIGANADSANLRKISLIRFDPERGKAVTQQIDGKEALLGDISQNVPLQNNDVIVVGRNLIGKINYALTTITQPFQSVLTFLLFFNNFRSLGGSSGGR